jgi:hypothetical protein
MTFLLLIFIIESKIKINLTKLPKSHTLSDLLNIFKQKSDMDKSGLYFLCDLQERYEIALILDEKDNIAFHNKYILSMTPVNLDNDKIKV